MSTKKPKQKKDKIPGNQKQQTPNPADNKAHEDEVGEPKQPKDNS